MSDYKTPLANSIPANLSSKKLHTTESSLSQQFWTEIRGYLQALLVAFLIVTFAFNTVGVVGSSMRPNLHGGPNNQKVLASILRGDRVFIPKYDTWLRRAGILGHYQRGEIVVVREPENSPTAQQRGKRPFFIKRIIGVPGDHIRMVSGNVFVNNHQINQSFISGSGEITPDPIDFPVVTQSNGQLTGFVMGFVDTLDGIRYPELSWHDSYLNTTPINDPHVQLYYGSTIASLESLPADAPENTPFILDLVVPENHYFIMGDNRQSAKGGSEDSRYFGAVTSLSIAGKASAVIWPPQRNGVWNWRNLTPPRAFESIPDSI